MLSPAEPIRANDKYGIVVVLIVILLVTLPPKLNVNVLVEAVYFTDQAAPVPALIPSGLLLAGKLETPLPDVNELSTDACVRLPLESVVRIPTIGYVPLASL